MLRGGREAKKHYLCIMKRLSILLFIAVLLVGCQGSPERPLPLQMTYAQRELDENKDGVFALYLLSELEDSIGQMPDYIQTRYKAMKAEAEKVKRMHPATHYKAEDIYDAIRQRDSLYQRQLEEERMLYEEQMQQYQRHLAKSSSRQWWGMGLVVLVLAGGATLWLLSSRLRRQRREEMRKLMPNDIEEHLARLADQGVQPTAEEWERLRQHVLQGNPNWEDRLHREDIELTPRDLQLCLLSTTSLRPKQVATLLNISQQNLRNLRVRLYTKVTGEKCVNVDQFVNWAKKG